MVQEEIERKTFAMVLHIGRFSERAVLAALSSRGRNRSTGRKDTGDRPSREQETYGRLTSDAVKIDLRGQNDLPVMKKAGRKHGISLEAWRKPDGSVLLFLTGRDARTVKKYLDELEAERLKAGKNETSKNRIRDGSAQESREGSPDKQQVFRKRSHKELEERLGKPAEALLRAAEGPVREREIMPERSI